MESMFAIENRLYVMAPDGRSLVALNKAGKRNYKESTEWTDDKGRKWQFNEKTRRWGLHPDSKKGGKKGDRKPAASKPKANGIVPPPDKPKDSKPTTLKPKTPSAKPKDSKPAAKEYSDRGKLREPRQIDLDSIVGVKPLNLSGQQKKHFDAYAESIAEFGGSMRVPVVVQKGIDEYSFADKQGELDYHAYNVARELNPTLPDRMRVMIVQPGDVDAVKKQMDALQGLSAEPKDKTPSAEPPVTSYQQFLGEVAKIYDELNRDYNLGDLVPIYRIRRQLGDRISRLQFTEWLLEIQASGLVRLMGAQESNITQDQLEDSITIPGNELRFYVRKKVDSWPETKTSAK